MQVVVCFKTRIEAEVAQGALAAQGIVSKLQLDDLGGSRAFPFSHVLGVELYVKKEDLKGAKQILQIE